MNTKSIPEQLRDIANQLENTMEVVSEEDESVPEELDGTSSEP